MKRLILLGLWILCQFAHLAGSIWMLIAIMGHPDSRRAMIIALAYDQLGNAVTGGDPDETISSRADRARAQGRRWGCILCRMLDAIDKDHCARAKGV